MKKFILVALCAMALFSCSDEEEELWKEIEIPIPNISKILFSEFCRSEGAGVSDVTKTEEFVFESKWLTDYVYTQKSSIANDTTILTNPLTILYGSNRNSITFTDETGIQRKYTLNDQGYATKCEYTSFGQKRNYTFSYTNGYLTQLIENIMPSEGSDDDVITQSLSFTYDKGDLISVTSPSLTGETFTGYGELQTNFVAGENTNYYHLPCFLLLDIYPLSFHREAMFARILGKPTQHLIVSSYPTQTIENYNEETKFTYRFDKDMPTGLTITTSYGYGNTRYSINRNISISFE